MNIFSINSLRKLTKFSLLFSLGFSSSSLIAGPLNISNNPLELAAGVDPNVMVLNDDSGSMDWSILVQGASEGLYATTSPARSFSYAYIQDDPENSNFFVVPSENTLNQFENFWVNNNYNEAQWRGVWRTLNSTFNSVYYNPNTEYKPWAGVDDSGALYLNANPAAARVDPYLSASATFNLTVNNAYVSVMPHEANAGVLYGLNENLYPARYYTWTDTDLDGNVDFDDAHQLVEIRTGAGCGTNAICPASFTRQGTRTDCGGSPQTPNVTVTCSAALELQNYANFYSYYRRRELTAKAAITRVLDPITSIRVGYATINNNSNNRIQVQAMNVDAATGGKRNLFDNIYQTQSNNGTPLRQNLEAMGQYFSCDSGNIFGSGNSSPGNNNCPVLASPAGECQQNYTILLTDGFWNGGAPTIQNADGDGTGGAAQGPFDGASFADNINSTLADVAMHYYERDIHSSLQDEVPATTRDQNRYVGIANPFNTMHQHMSTYTVGIGVMGNRNAMPDDVTTNPATFNAGAQTGWPDPVTGGDLEKIDDLRHAAWNGRGDFLSAADQTALTNSLQNIFDDIQEGKGAASAVAFNSQDLQSGARVFRALFNANQNTGSLISQDISITGVISPAVNWDAAVNLSIKAAAEAAAAASAGTRSTDSRTIISYNPITPGGIPFRWAALDTTQQDKLKLPTIANATPIPEDLGMNRLNYLRGRGDDEGTNTNSGEFRERSTDLSDRPLILGDIIHSAPVFVGAPPFTNLDEAPFPDTAGNLYSEFAATFDSRRELVYVGANDGMLHGFDANSGDEVFSYIPNSILSSITQLTDPDYAHRYFVDMTSAINDVFIAPASGTNAGVASWNTVAVTGLGVGGPGYFALNLTNPASFTSELSAASNVMWEFTQDDDVGTGPTNNNLNLGAHIREPVIVMTNVDGAGGQKRWAAIFGNGYNSASADGDAELYIVFLDGGLDGAWTRGSDFVKLNTGNGKAESGTNTPNGLGSVQAIDIDANGTADVVYAGDYQGNLYRFNISSTTVGGLTNSSNRPVQKLFKATYNSSGGPVQPITNRPAVVKHPNLDGYLVMIGTGSYFTAEDSSSTDLQSIYGIWDDFIAPSDNIVTVSYNKLLEQSFTSSGLVNGFTTRTLSNDVIDYGTNGQRKQGWVINLDVVNAGNIEFPGERAVRNILIRGDSAFVNSVIPRSSTACTTGPGSFTISFKTENGGGGQTPVFDTNGDGIFDADDNVGGIDGENNVVAAIRSDTTTLTDSSIFGKRLVSQGGDQSISDIGINPGGDEAGETLGRHSWREIEN